MLQFISSSGGLGSGGKKQKMYTKMRNRTENRLIANPKRPRFHLRARRGSLRQRLKQTQEMDTIYDDKRALTPSDVMLLYATTEPILMSESSIETTTVNITAFNGISQPVGTFSV
jgi:hypothetical protein